MDHGILRRRDAPQGKDRSKAKGRKRRESEPADRLGEVGERVRPLIPVERSVRQGAHAARIEDQHDSPARRPAQRDARGWARK
jgi:hypothetical protein